jgi:STE24 endopeptidase
MNTLLVVIVGIITAEFVLERVLSYLNSKTWSYSLPDALQGIYEEEKYKKAQQYAAAKEKLENISSIFSYLTTMAMLLLGGFAYLDNLVNTWVSSPIWVSLVFFGVIGFASDLIGLPFELYSIFVIEEKFGFNKMTIGTFIADKLKGWLLGALLGGLLLFVFLWLHESFTTWFWLYAWVVFAVFTFILTTFYTSLIVPIFNKLTPLQDGELRSAIESYAKKVNFPLKNIMVIDGSKRSKKANAYFSGLGKSKSIVLYDTLIEKQTTDELVAVLAHEVGHYKHKHTLQNLVITNLNMLFTLYILHLTIDNPALTAALGVTQPAVHLGLIVFGILYSPLSVITSLLMNIFSRKNEFEADDYARQTFNGASLISALKKLSTDSLSNLTPHKAYVFFHYSHPPLLQRMEALLKNAS